ncbi:MAG: NAD(P)-dependent oxidoreductase [Betaproteobacteria bacterium]|nr:NAD(P)-dependent oxidoreductase [Betaproteobacteria bacterium]
MKPVQVGWIGCGKLGRPMAAHLLEAGHSVVAFDIDQASLAALAARGAKPAASILQVCSAADVVFSSLPDDRVLLTVSRSPDGVLAHLKENAIFVDTSTVSPSASADVAARASELGRRYLRVAVSGNPVLAESAQLTAFASGASADFAVVEPLLAHFSKRIFLVGPDEQARTLKLVINLMIAVSAGMLGEALALGEKGGLDWQQMLDVISESAVGSPMVRYKTPPLSNRDYRSTFSCEQMAKDLDLILDASAQYRAPVPLAAQMRQMYEALIAGGRGADDYIATVAHAEQLAGLTAHARQPPSGA